ncbi:MAG: hypothetical protein AAGG38_02275 [Planctomycetota bacterium]
MVDLLPSVTLADPTARLSDHFVGLDWAVMLGYLVLVSALGVRLAGRQASPKDFFRGGDKLPWYAVSGSMIATIISAVTFVAVPAIIYRDSGNFTYLQFGLIAGLLARLFVAFFLVPTYFRDRIYSPYDYIGNRLGPGSKTVTTALFTVLGVLSQSARVYLTASILALVLDGPLAWLEAHTGVVPLVSAVALVGVIAVVWTMLGGIATVIWTDAMLFVVFVVGGLVALGVILLQLPGGWSALSEQAHAAGKFDLWSIDLAFDATQPYTLWAALFAVTFGNIGSYGTDQLLAQRIFCCKNTAHARAAVLGSWLGEAVVALMLTVGVGLWAYYRAFPERLAGAAGEVVAADPDMIFPVFILTQVPAGLTGLIIAGIFAAAISSLTSILAALSQTTLSAFVLPLKMLSLDADLDASAERQLVRWSRTLVLGWGISLCVFAYAIDAYVQHMAGLGRDVPFLDLALGLSNYVIGALLAAFLLAWFPLAVNGYGLWWSAPLSIAAVFAARFHEPRAQILCVAVGTLLTVLWITAALRGPAERRASRLSKTPLVVLAALTVWLISRYLVFPGPDQATLSLAWPWYAPLGGAVAFVFGWVLGDPRPAEPAAPSTGSPVSQTAGQ